MRDIIPELRRWRLTGKTDIVLATILETRGSSLRPPGTRMAAVGTGVRGRTWAVGTAGMDVAGSVSSGCVDGDVIAEMEVVLNGGVSIRRPSYGISDEQAWGVGLSCGGAIDVLVERWTELHDGLMDEIEAKRTVGFATRTGGSEAGRSEAVVGMGEHLLHRADGTTLGTLGDPDLDGQVLMNIAAAWPGPYAQRHAYTLQGTDGQAEVFVEVIPPPPVLLIFGATDIGVALSKIGKVSGFEVIANDARRTFARSERFPDAELRFGWPQDTFTPEELGPSCAAVVLFHDPKFDIPALSLALRSEAFYIGFLGSRKTQADRRAELLQEGFKESDLARIHGPVGLDIGGKTPALIALSIMAEIVAVQHRKRGGMLRDRQEREQPWLPDPIPAESLCDREGWANINRSPHDRVSGVVYKRAASTKRVLYDVADAPSDEPAGDMGQGQVVVRWLFSEAPGTQERLLPDRGFQFLQDVILSPGARTEQRSHSGLDTIVYVIDGCGALSHRPTTGSPIVVRPLRPGDAALIAGSELYGLENFDAVVPLRVILLGLATNG